MINLSIALAKSGENVVVRPHPSESLEVWRKKLKNTQKKLRLSDLEILSLG